MYCAVTVVIYLMALNCATATGWAAHVFNETKHARMQFEYQYEWSTSSICKEKQLIKS